MVDAPATQQLRTALVGRLERRIDELVDAVCSAIIVQVIPYQQLARPATLKEFRSDIRTSLHTYLRTIARRTGVTPQDLDRFRRLGAERARQGLSSRDVVDALEAGMGACWRYVRQAAMEGDDDPRVATEVVAELAVEAFAILKEVSGALVAGHASEQGRGTYTHARTVAEFVARLVDGTRGDERDLQRASRTVGVEIGQRWTLLL
ncbi:MAG: hypothetical protein M3394_01905, partial [Actinomycetota bacterium]|nr:hypothetical protein [Actinomycetota bacterium]